MEDFGWNENTISMILGALVVIVVGVLIVMYFKNHPNQVGVSEEQYCRTGYSNISLRDTPNKCLKYFVGGGENINGK